MTGSNGLVAQASRLDDTTDANAPSRWRMRRKKSGHDAADLVRHHIRPIGVSLDSASARAKRASSSVGGQPQVAAGASGNATPRAPTSDATHSAERQSVDKSTKPMTRQHQDTDEGVHQAHERLALADRRRSDRGSQPR